MELFLERFESLILKSQVPEVVVKVDVTVLAKNNALFKPLGFSLKFVIFLHCCDFGEEKAEEERQVSV